MPRHPVVRRAHERVRAGAAGAPRVEHPAHHRGVDVGQVDQRHQGGPGVPAGERVEPRRAARRPSPRPSPRRRRPVDARWRRSPSSARASSACGAEHDGDRGGSPAASSRSTAASTTRRPVRVGEQRLGPTHPAPGAGGEDQPDDVRRPARRCRRVNGAGAAGPGQRDPHREPVGPVGRARHLDRRPVAEGAAGDAEHRVPDGQPEQPRLGLLREAGVDGVLAPGRARGCGARARRTTTRAGSRAAPAPARRRGRRPRRTSGRRRPGAAAASARPGRRRRSPAPGRRRGRRTPCGPAGSGSPASSRGGVISSAKPVSRGTGRRRVSATKVPRPGIRSSSPSATSASRAWRTVIRATPKSWTSSRSDGAGVPGSAPPRSASGRTRGPGRACARDAPGPSLDGRLTHRVIPFARCHLPVTIDPDPPRGTRDGKAPLRAYGRIGPYSVVIARSTSRRAARRAGKSAARTPTTAAATTKISSVGHGTTSSVSPSSLSAASGRGRRRAPSRAQQGAEHGDDDRLEPDHRPQLARGSPRSPGAARPRGSAR